ncbi:MAG TPA: hypothetical protein VNV85_07585 [Puia sp.]|nr:hypothetical protein [Puia sp.]
MLSASSRARELCSERSWLTENKLAPSTVIFFIVLNADGDGASVWMQGASLKCICPANRLDVIEQDIKTHQPILHFYP